MAILVADCWAHIGIFLIAPTGPLGIIHFHCIALRTAHSRWWTVYDLPDRVISYASYFSISTFSFSCFCRVGAQIMQLIVRHVNYLAPETRSLKTKPLPFFPLPSASTVKWVIKPTFERAIKSRFLSPAQGGGREGTHPMQLSTYIHS